jgi:ribosomal protein S18 acetylase RimI-like enzyme
VSIVFRPAHAEELYRAEELVIASINDLTERHGFGTMATLRPPDFQLFSLKDDPDGLWVAEADGAILGFAFSWVCDDLGFLAELFVAPAHQGRGIGSGLLARTFEHAKNAGATTKALITFTFNIVSQGLYIRHGLFPRLPIYFFSAERDVVTKRLQGKPLRCSNIEATASHLSNLARIDAGALGISREKHHRYLLNDGTMKGYFFHEGADCIGYAHISAGGHIGPLAMAKRDAMCAAFKTALNLAAGSGASEVSAFLPGAGGVVLSIAAEHGMRLTFPMVLVSTRDFGDWTRYLPRNPGFM